MNTENSASFPVRTLVSTTALLLLCFASFFASAEEVVDPEQATALHLPWTEFDQTLSSGWRILADRNQYLVAAQLIETYLRTHEDLTVPQRAVSSRCND